MGNNSRRGGEVIMMWALLPVESSNNKLMCRPPCPAFTFHPCVKGLEFNDVFFFYVRPMAKGHVIFLYFPRILELAWLSIRGERDIGGSHALTRLDFYLMKK